MSFIGDLLGGGAVKIPEAQIPAAPAPTRREDAGAEVTLGTTLGSQRLSGKTTAAASAPSSASYDVLGGLGYSSALTI